MLSEGKPFSQPPWTTAAYPWATLITTIPINLACQVSPLEDTLVSTKRMTFHCKLQDTARGFTPHTHDSNPTQIGLWGTNKWRIGHNTSIYQNGEYLKIWMIGPLFCSLDYSEHTYASWDLKAGLAQLQQSFCPYKQRSDPLMTPFKSERWRPFSVQICVRNELKVIRGFQTSFSWCSYSSARKHEEHLKL